MYIQVYSGIFKTHTEMGVELVVSAEVLVRVLRNFCVQDNGDAKA